MKKEMYGIKVTYSCGDEESPEQFGVFETAEAAYKKAVNWLARKRMSRMRKWNAERIWTFILMVIKRP